jgi:3-methyladenine DNA glycosylase Tag
VEIPERIERPTPSDALAVVSRAIFQAGLSWKLIESKWPHYLRLFESFDPVRVARRRAFDTFRNLHLTLVRKRADARL